MRKALSPSPPLSSAIRALRRVDGPLVLAVSGGLDSMTLLHVAARDRRVRDRCTVATFDHATGPHAQRAVRLVRSTARSLGLPIVVGRARETGTSEAAWRAMRWRFLRSVAARRKARIVTAHTRDDQLETVVMRLLRGAAARGIAALYANGEIVRPFLGTSRRSLERYARGQRLTFVDDPTNMDLRFLRNRVRHELLPALRAVSPRFERDLLGLSRRAARVRRETERFVGRIIQADGNRQLRVSARDLAGIDRAGLTLLWPAILARLSVALDRRGVVRAAEFAVSAEPGKRIQCSGGVTIERTRDAFVVLRAPHASASATRRPGSMVEFGQWSLREVSRAAFTSHIRREGDAWGAILNRRAAYDVRAWQPGDRVHVQGQSRVRRVTRFFSEQAIPVSERSSWPVVTVDDEVLWVPGVWRPTSSVRQAGNELTFLVCERRVG